MKKKEDDNSLKPFFIDEQKLKLETKQTEATRGLLNRVLSLYRSLCPEDPIETIGQLQKLVANPREKYCDWRVKKNEEEENPLQLWAISGGFSIDKLKSEMIVLPPGFDQIENLCARIKFRPENYSLIAGQVELSESLMSRLINKTHFYAVTPEQKERLEFAQSLCDLLNNRYAELLKKDASEVNPLRVESSIISKAFIGGIPYCLRLRVDPEFRDPKRLSFEKKILQPNEQWVVFGWKAYANQAELPELTKSQARPQNNYTRYKMFYRTDFDGGRRPYIIAKEGIKEAKNLSDPLRLEETVFLPGEYYFINGRLVKAEDN